MTLETFKKSIDDGIIPNNLNPVQQALWHDGAGDWYTAHSLIDNLEEKDAAHVHAYLHRKEGDQWNANYWYGKAGQPRHLGALTEEWLSLVRLYVDTAT